MTTPVVELLSRLDYPEAQLADLTEAVEVVPPHFRFRAIAVPSLDAIVSESAHDEPYASIRQQVVVPKPFSLVHAPWFFLLLVAAGRTVCGREVEARVATRRLSSLSCRRFSESIYAQPILLSAGGRFDRFIEMSAKMPDFFQNFSTVDFDRVASRHVRLRYSDSLSKIAGEYVLPGFWEGMCETFGVRGQIETTSYDPYNFDLDVRWE